MVTVTALRETANAIFIDVVTNGGFDRYSKPETDPQLAQVLMDETSVDAAYAQNFAVSLGLEHPSKEVEWDAVLDAVIIPEIAPDASYFKDLEQFLNYLGNNLLS